MDDSQLTRPSLLVRIRDAKDSGAWSQFVKVYSPLVYRYMQQHGLQNADAADVTQDVLRTVSRAIRGFDYDRSRGTFRGWLMSVARTRLCDFLASRERQAQGTGDTAMLTVLKNLPSQQQDTDRWEQEYHKCVFDWAVDEIRDSFQESTWQAFWQTNVEGKETKQVADSLGMTVEAVYLARSRVLARLKKAVKQVGQE